MQDYEVVWNGAKDGPGGSSLFQPEPGCREVKEVESIQSVLKRESAFRALTHQRRAAASVANKLKKREAVQREAVQVGGFHVSVAAPIINNLLVKIYEYAKSTGFTNLCSPTLQPRKILTCQSCKAKFTRSELWQDVVDRCLSCFPQVPKINQPREAKRCMRCSSQFSGTARQCYCSPACRRLAMLSRNNSRPHWRQLRSSGAK